MRDYFQLTRDAQRVRERTNPFEPRTLIGEFGKGGAKSAARRLRRAGDNTILARDPQDVALAHMHPRSNREFYS